MTNIMLPTSFGYPFIGKVRMCNFKSVAAGDTELAPFTLIVGENSSGKSTILQSLRVIQQGMEDNYSKETFRLNGGGISLGTISDLRTDQADKDDIVSLGIDLIVPHYNTAPLADDEAYDDEYEQTVFDYTTGPDTVPGSFRLAWDIGLQGRVTDEIGAAYIQFLGLGVTDLEDHELSFSLILQRPEQNLTDKIFRNAVAFNTIGIGYTAPDLIAFEAKLDTKDTLPSVPLYATIEGSLPSRLMVDSDTPEVRDWIAEENRRNLKSSLLMLLDLPKEDLVDLLTNMVTNTLKDVPDVLASFRSGLSELSQEELADILKKTATALPEPEGAQVYLQEQWKDLWSDILFYARFYRSIMRDDNISYIGPLRKAPQHTGEKRGATARGDIGQQGEFTGRVLYSMGDTWVSVLMPKERQISRVKLVEAVGSWAKELGLAEGVGTEDRAAEGITIRVQSHGMESGLPLTSVGVGVSQLLPVLVLCLLAEPGSVILLEQPELHLHPALQQRLADFFIAMVRSGRQLIVETHSEYMVSRLRRRIVEDPEDELLGLAKVVFAERDRETGLSSYRDVELSPYGAIEEWPAGFFDQAAEEERAIILGGVKKLRKRTAERQRSDA